MKRKIRCIYIDGIERSGKTSVAREMRKFLKNKNKDLCDINGTDNLKLVQQNTILSDSENSFILKENSILSSFQKEVKKTNMGISLFEVENEELIRKERSINHKYGAVHFFLIPQDDESLTRIYDVEEVPLYVIDTIKLYRGINHYSMTQGLDIRLIPFNEFDKIYDIRDKILKIIKENYEI